MTTTSTSRSSSSSSVCTSKRRKAIAMTSKSYDFFHEQDEEEDGDDEHGSVRVSKSMKRCCQNVMTMLGSQSYDFFLVQEKKDVVRLSFLSSSRTQTNHNQNSSSSYSHLDHLRLKRQSTGFRGPRSSRLLLFLILCCSVNFTFQQQQPATDQNQRRNSLVWPTSTWVPVTQNPILVTPNTNLTSTNSYQLFVPTSIVLSSTSSPTTTSTSLSSSLPNSMSFNNSRTNSSISSNKQADNFTESTVVNSTKVDRNEEMVDDEQLRLMENLSLNFYRSKRRSSSSFSSSTKNRKRKRELFAYTSIIANEENTVRSSSSGRKLLVDDSQTQDYPKSSHKTLRSLRSGVGSLSTGSSSPGTLSRYWSGHSSVSPSVGSRRMRRLSGHLHSSPGTSSNAHSPSSSSSSSSSLSSGVALQSPGQSLASLSIYAKVNLKPSSLSSFSSSSSSLSSAASGSPISASLSSFSGMIPLVAPSGGVVVNHHNHHHGATNSLGSSNSNPINPNNIRMKIMLNPPGGFGPGMAVVAPDQKCNFEIYPSGCFDENGSICDSSGSKHCVCRPGYNIRIGGIYCLRPAAIGEACYTTEQCERKVANSGCFNYREEYREENPSAFFGPSQTQWPMGECRCRVGHRYSEPQQSCVRSLIGSWCSNVWDCELVELKQVDNSGGGNHSGSSSGHRSTHSSHSTKRANLVCENNQCNCSQHFHYNESSEQCQFRETYGQQCYPIPAPARPNSALLAGLDSSKLQKRSLHGRRSLIDLESSNNNNNNDPTDLEMMMLRDESRSYAARTATLDGDTDGRCNMPTVCNENGTCSCADGYEHQPEMSPQCQLIGKATAGSHYFHSGNSNRGGAKSGSDGPGLYGGEGQSNIGNFVEYVLYVLVPALIIIFMFKPCFRRIGEWRNHIHHYQSDSDFFLGGGAGGVPGLRGPSALISEMNVIGSSSAIVSGPEKNGALIGPGIVPPGVGAYAGDYVSPYAFAPHLACHNAYIFEPAADPCGVYGPGPYSQSGLVPGQGNPAAMALLREKLQTIEECQSEDNLQAGLNGSTELHGQCPQGQCAGGGSWNSYGPSGHCASAAAAAAGPNSQPSPQVDCNNLVVESEGGNSGLPGDQTIDTGTVDATRPERLATISTETVTNNTENDNNDSDVDDNNNNNNNDDESST